MGVNLVITNLAKSLYLFLLFPLTVWLGAKVGSDNLWRFHAVHHSPNRLYWFNAGRFHPVEKFLFQIPELLPFILLNPSEEVLMLYLITNGIHGFFQHSNIAQNIGVLNYVFSMTELHRWHHSKVIGICGAASSTLWQRSGQTGGLSRAPRSLSSAGA